MAVISTGLTLGLRLTLVTWLADRPLLIFFLIPIILSAYVGGLGPGLVATALSAAGTAYFLAPHTHALLFDNERDLVQWLIFVVTGALICVLNEALRRSQRRDRATIAQLQEARERLQASMREAGEFWAALNEHALVTMTDPRGLITFANDRFCAISGYPREQLIGQDHRILNSGHHPKGFFQEMWETIAQGRVWRGEIKNRAHDGTFHWLDTTIMAFPDAVTGNPWQYVAIRADITERKRAEKALQNSEHRFRALLEHSGDSIALIDAQNEIIYLSPSVVEVEGYAADELIGRNGAEHTHPDDLPRVQEYVRELLAHPGQPTPVLWRRRHKDGRWLWLEGTATNLLHDPAVRAIVTNYRDVTARRQAEEALDAEHTLMRTLIDQIPDLIYVKDGAGQFRLANEAVTRLMGALRPADLLGKTDAAYYPARLAADFRAREERVLAGEALVDYEETLPCADGSVRVFLTTKLPLRDREARVTGLVGIGRDITERKRTEQTFRLFRALVDQSTDAFEIIDPATGRFFDVNAKACAATGYSHAELLTMAVPDLDPTISPAGWPALAEKIRAAGTLGGEGTHRRKDGTSFPIEFNASWVRLDRDYIVTVVRDISERQRTQREAAREQARFQFIFGSVPVGIA